MIETKKGAGIQSLQIGLSIVDLVAKHERPISFSEICETTQITKSNLYKYLHTLTAMGVLYRDKFSGLYSLGHKLVEYGMAAVNQENIVDRVTPYLHEINRECKETVIFSIWTHYGPIVIKMLTSKQVLNIGAQIGTYLPIYSSTGKIFAALMAEHQIQEWKQRELRALSKDKQQELARELQMIKKERATLSYEPLVQSVSSAAVPILNYHQELLGVITLVGFNDSIPLQKDNETIRYLIHVSQTISKSYGYHHQ